MTSDAIVAVTLVLLFVGGIGYAIRVVRRPPRPGLTWVSVVIGCFFTNAAISILVWELTQDWRAALVVPWGCYALTGGPMIMGQVLKNQQQFDETCRFFEEQCGRDKG